MTMIRRLLFIVFLVTPLSSALAYEEVHRCDEFAAHPSDSERWAKGVADADLVPAPAIVFCEAAVNEYADVTRFQFQLARAYWAAGRQKDAMSIFGALAEQNHGPSLFYLSLALQKGAGNTKIDPALARKLADSAAAAGFTANVPVVAAPEIKAFNAKLYNQPHIIAALNNGQAGAMRIVGVGQTTNYVPLAQEVVYLSGLHNSFASPVSKVLDRSCVLLHKPSVGERLVARAMNDAFGGAGNLDNMAKQGWGMIGKMMSDLSKGDMNAMMQKQRNTELLRQMGEQDGERLMVTHGCSSDVTRRVYANLEAFATGAPFVTPAGKGSANGPTPVAVESESAIQLRKRWEERQRLRQLDAARQSLTSQ